MADKAHVQMTAAPEPATTAANATAKEHATATNEEMAGLEQVTTNARPSCFRSTFQEMLFVLTATMAIAMTSFLTGSLTVTSSYIGRDLGMPTAQVTWLASAPSLAAGSFLLFFGKVADFFGRKALFVGSLFIFAVLNLGAGFMHSGIGLDILTGVMGLTGASAVPPAVGLLGVIYNKPSKRKNAAFACFSAGNPIGFVGGTLFGGIAAELFGWRASFWLIAIIFVVFTAIGIFSVPGDFEKKEPFSLETLKRFDLVGVALTIAGIGLFSAALSLGDSAPKGWSTGYVIAFLAIGLVLTISFVFWENWVAYPLIPMKIWLDKNFSLNLAVLSLGFMSFTPASFFIALFFQEIWQFNPLMVAVHLLPMVIVGIAVNVVAGMILHTVSNKLLMLIGTLAYSIAFLLLAVNRSSSSYWAFCFPSFILIVVGADLEFNVANMYVMSSMPREQQSVAGGIFQTVARLCQTIGLGIATAVFSSVEQKSAGLSSLGEYWDRATAPYAATFWAAFAMAAFSVCLVPFMTIGTQGGKEKKIVDEEDGGASGGSSVNGDEVEAEGISKETGTDKKAPPIASAPSDLIESDRWCRLRG
ncbi:major facilitator superfamily transporter [Polychaeton citri CBS 116435]|uniref:Major facilitator superfamily transporter n=1 Tax=Polychaeton citri CBS 116435 TaxID=1314669 RepID=A0A9P4URH3_9PEZI|nr:major facilitator superfamily transporter [Polychaeton citri CBS 116435]